MFCAVPVIPEEQRCFPLPLSLRYSRFHRVAYERTFCKSVSRVDIVATSS
jgi:hypothetical protein